MDFVPRQTLLVQLNVADPNVRPMPNLGDMTYEEWREGKGKSEAIDKQTKIARNIRGAWYGKYGGKK